MASIKKTKSGKYQVTVYIGGGINKQKVVTADTKDEALSKALQIKQEMLNGIPTGVVEHCEKTTTNPTITVGEAIDRYIAAKERIISPTTLDNYTCARKNQLQSLMTLPMSMVTSEVVQLAINTDAIKVATKTIRNAYGLLSSAIKMFAPSVNLMVTLPKCRKKDIYVPDDKEVAEIYELVKAYAGGRLIKPFLLATQCGLRASEIAGLRTNCIKPDCVIIKQAMVHTTKGEIVKTPKSITSTRSIPISSTLYDILVNNCAGDVVCDISSHELTQVWWRFRNKYDLPNHLNFHALRHHFASACLLKGIPQKYIAELMGHSDTTMIERVYQHTFPSAMAKYANIITSNTDDLVGVGMIKS